jgi:hypothetical protein
LFGLPASAEHRGIPSAGAANAMSAPPFPKTNANLLEHVLLLLGLAALFGFEDKAAPPVKINKSGGVRSVCISEMDRSLEDILVFFGLTGRGLWSPYIEQFAQLDKKQLVI